MKRYIKASISDYLSTKDLAKLKSYLLDRLEIYVEEFFEFSEPIPEGNDLVERIFMFDGPIPDGWDGRLVESVYDMYFDYPEFKDFVNNLINDTIAQLKRELS